MAKLSDLAGFLSSRTPDQLAGILHRRPEVCWGAPIAGLSDLAERLSHPGALEATLRRVPEPCLQLLHGVLALGPRPTTAALLDLIPEGGDSDERRPGGPSKTAAVMQTLTELEGLALVWRSGEVLGHDPALRLLFPRPMGIGRTVQASLDRANRHELAGMCGAWRLSTDGSKAALTDRLVRVLTDPARVTGMLGRAPAHIRTHLEQLASAQVERVRVVTRTGQHREAEGWARQRGLLVGGIYDIPEIPVEVVLALGTGLTGLRFTPRPPEHPTQPVDPRAVHMGAAAAAADVTQSVAALIDRLTRTPAAGLKAGGVGSRELIKIGKALASDETRVRVDLELLRDLGLLEGSDGTLRVASAGAAWRAEEPGIRFADLVATWWGLPIHPSIGRDDDGKVLPAAGRRVVAASAQVLRTLAVTLIEELGPDRALADPAALTDVFAWHRPLARHDAQTVAAVWQEAHTLGVLVGGALTPVGRCLLDGDAGRLLAVAADLLPPAASAGRFGSDLTVLVAGSPSAAVSALLDTCADREGRGAAVIWRFSAASLRRAFDEGWTADELTAALHGIAELEHDLPQPLTYLIGDVARRHGHLVVLPATSCVRSADPALLREVVAHRSLRHLRPHLVADTVAVFQLDPTTVVEALRGAGFAPVPADEHGVVDLRRSRPDERTGADRRHSTERAAARSLDLLAPARPTPEAELGEAERVLDLATRLLRSTGATQGARTALEEQLDLFAPNLEPLERRQLGFAIDHQLPVVITYESATGGVTTRTISDLQLIADQLYAWCHLRQDQRVFNVIRIRSVVPVGS